MAVAFHASGSNSQTTAIASFSITCAINLNDSVVFVGSWDSGSTTTPTVFTTGGSGTDTFTSVYGPFTGPTCKFGGWLLPQAGSGRTGITISWASSTPLVADGGCCSYSGHSSPILDQVAENNSTGTVVSSGNTPTLLSTDEFAIEYGQSSGTVVGTGAPWTDDGVIPVTQSWFGHQVLTNTTPVASTFTNGTSTDTITTFVMTFKNVGGPTILLMPKSKVFM